MNDRESPFARIFKAYDVRGVYPAELTAGAVSRIARAYVDFLKPKSVIVGRDVRESGPVLAGSATRALVESGVDVIDVGIVPVDMFYFAVGSAPVSGGIFVSASHNPREWNGLNFTREGALPISSDSGLHEIRARAEAGVSVVARQKGAYSTKDVRGAYFDFVSTQAKLSHLAPAKAVINGNFGVSAAMFRAYAAHAGLPLTLVGINEAPDGTFPKGPPNPLLPENREEMTIKVREARADLGIAWDADGDRCFFFDENGRFIEGYFITAVLAGEILARNPGATVLIDPRLTWATEDVARARGGKTIITRPGMTLIPERMRKENAVFAGEMSSHFYFRETFSRDNGFLPALLILNLMSREEKKLSEIIAPLTEKYFVSGELNFSVRDAHAIIRGAEAAYKDGALTHVDGVSVEYPDWRFNLRASNTEPLLRLNVEARRRSILARERRKLVGFIERNAS